MKANSVKALGCAALLSLACESTPLSTPPSTLHGASEVPAAKVQPLPAPSFGARTLSLPDASPRPPTTRLLDESRFSLRVQDADLRTLLLGVGRDSAFNTVVDPAVTGRVSADFQNLSLREILDELLRPAGYHYSVRGNVLRIFEAPRVTRTYRVDYPNYQRQGSSDLTVSGAIAAKPAMGDTKSSGSQDTSTSGVKTVQIVDFWAELEEGLQNLVAAGAEDGGSASEESEQPSAGVARVSVARQAGLVTVSASAQTLLDVEEYLREISLSSQRQVLIDVKILEVDIGDDLDLGVDWEAAASFGGADGSLGRAQPGLDPAFLAQTLAPMLPTGGFMFGVAGENLSASLAALASQRDVRVVSTPRIATLNNHKALIKVVRNEIFFLAETEVEVVEQVGGGAFTEFTPQVVPVGVTLDITPQISDDGQITMHIHPSISEVVDVVPQPLANGQTEAGSLPVIDLRETDTVMRVGNEVTILIGGLIQSRELERRRKVPWLGDIPWLGQVFRRTEIEESRTELIILVTPRILDAPMITHIREEAEASIGAISKLRRERLPEGPWWRRPYGQYYEQEADDGAL